MKIGLVFFHIRTPVSSQIIKGISRYYADHTSSDLLSLPSLEPLQYAFIEGLDGVLGRFTIPQTMHMEEIGMPFVNFSYHLEGGRGVEVWTDFHHLCDVALSHLSERGCCRVGMVSTADPAPIEAHETCRVIQEHTSAYGMDYLGRFSENQTKPWTFTQHLQNLTEWLKGLPSPAAILTTDSDHSLRVLLCLKALDKKIPGDFRILCLYNDDILLECSQPGISNVHFDQAMRGYMGAEHLHQQILNQKPESKRIHVPVKGVSARESTAYAAAPGSPVEKALTIMREWETDLPSLDEIAQISGMSRSTLTRKFQQHLGQTPGEILHQIRLEKALSKLRSGSESLAEITDLCGYGLPSQLGREVKRKTGMTPKEYRNNWQSA